MSCSLRLSALVLTLLSSSVGAQHQPTSVIASDAEWTNEAIVTVPEIGGIAVSADGREAAYIVRSADLPADRQRSALHLADLRTGANRRIVEGRWLESLQRNDARGSWNFLADLGEGVQLYEARDGQSPSPVLVNAQTVMTGAQDGAISLSSISAPRPVGILAYSWSADGQMLWYSKLLPVDGPRTRVHGEEVRRAWGTDRRWAPRVVVELRILLPDGRDVLVDTRPATDRLALRARSNAQWEDHTLRYVTADSLPGEELVFSDYFWDLENGARRSAEPPANPVGRAAIGPNGGILATVGLGDARRLVERRPDGSVHEHGNVGFTLEDTRGPANWRVRDGSMTVLGTRSFPHARYGLTIVDRAGLHPVETPGSLTQCGYASATKIAACVREGVTAAPQLVRVDLVTRAVEPVASLAPRHATIAPLRVEPRLWTNARGHYASGFVTFPRNYEAGRRYPAIFVTHGSDADERFASPELQWDYPIQVLAERGYLIVSINDPSPRQNETLMRGIDAWGGDTGMPYEEVQDLMWQDVVRSYEAAAAALDAEGLIDRARLGIAGFSRGSQMVNVAMTQSRLFRAASSGDGGYLEPSGYHSSPVSYRSVFGGPPFEADAIPHYQRLSPSFRASVASGPVLQQIARPSGPRLDFYVALRRAGVPSEISLYPGEGPESDETHLFHIPSNRLAAMQENIDWFDFWLRDQIDPDPAKAGQYRRWQEMRDETCANRDVAARIQICR